MLKKAVAVQIFVLIVEITIGSFLLGQFDQSVKMVHGAVGLAVVLASSTVVYFAFRERISPLITSLATLSGVFTVLAYIGGKMTSVNYDQGLLMMRISAIAALVISIFCFYKLQKATKTSGAKK